MHLLVNLATDASKIPKVFKNNVSEGSSHSSFSNSNQYECGAARFGRTSANAITEKGSDKAGVAAHFKTFLDGKKRMNMLMTFRSHRINDLFKDAAATYHHLNDTK